MGLTETYKEEALDTIGKSRIPVLHKVEFENYMVEISGVVLGVENEDA
jgi:hypothetical protein